MTEKNIKQKLAVVSCLHCQQGDVQTRFQKSWDTVQIVNKNRMQ